MANIGELSVEEFQGVLNEFFAVPEKRQKMTLAEIKQIAGRLNTVINIPIIRETGEEKILIKIVLKVDTFIYNSMPNELYDLIRSVDEGINDEEAERLIIRLSKLANEKIDIPYIPEQLEYVVIRFIIAILINSARKKFKFSDVIDKVSQLAIPGNKDANDNQLKKLVIKREESGEIASKKEEDVPLQPEPV